MMMRLATVPSRIRRSRIAQYLAAVVTTAVALYCRRVLTPVWGDSLTFITLFPAIAFSAWFGGFTPGAAATLLCAVGAYIWLPTRFSVGSTFGDVLAFAFFCGVGLFISGLTRDVREARMRAERTAGELQRSEQARENALVLERAARAEAERANHAKDAFPSIVAHELKQPLSAMLAALPVLRHRLGPDSSQAEHTIDVFQRQVLYLTRLVDDLLDASRVVNGRVTLERRTVDAATIVRDAVELMGPRAQQKHQRVTVTLPEAAIPVTGDAVRLQQVFMNVLSNAVIYTPPNGESHVTAATDTDHVTIEVQEIGDGIAAEDLSRIFGLFARAGDGQVASGSDWPSRGASSNCTGAGTPTSTI